MYDEYKLKKTRGFALGIFGSFVFSFSSVVIVMVTQQLSYIVIASMSVGCIALIYLAVKAHSFFGQVAYAISAGIVLAAEASLVFLEFNSPSSSLYAAITLLGATLALKGIRDIESYREGQKEAKQVVNFQSEMV